MVTTVDGHPVRTTNDLVNPIADTPIGEKVDVVYLRNGEQLEATLTVEDRTKIFPERVNDDVPDEKSAPSEAAPAEFGLHAEDLKADRAHRAYFQDVQGVLVTDVAPVSFAEDIGFIRGDLIAQINQNVVASMADYRKAMASLKPGQQAVFKVLRHDDTQRMLTVYLAGVVPSAAAVASEGIVQESRKEANQAMRMRSARIGVWRCC